jgi:hypothetical protein
MAVESTSGRTSMNKRHFEYAINADDVVTFVNDAWLDFARENDGGDLVENVIGSWLWQHLAGVEVKNLFRALLDRVRDEQKPVQIPFRCDAPELRRYMTLRLRPLPDLGVHFTSKILEETDRTRISLLEAGRPYDPDRSLPMCAWCKRLEAGPAGWEELEEALRKSEIFHIQPLPRITHTVCPDCRSQVSRELGMAG